MAEDTERSRLKVGGREVDSGAVISRGRVDDDYRISITMMGYGDLEGRKQQASKQATAIKSTQNQ